MCLLLKSLQLAALLAAVLPRLAYSDTVTEEANDDSNMIVGGSKVKIEDVPYQVALFRDQQLICGGTIIGPRWVLTAYHCVEEPVSYGIVVGLTKPKRGAMIPVENIFVHPDLEQGALYDVALLLLGENFKYDDSVQCLEMLSSSDALVPGKPAIISGYGTTREGGFDSPLKAATISILPASKCVEAYQDLMQSHMICAGFEEGKVDSCQGDSGGPLVVDGMLAGTVFFGRGCGRPNSPGVYMSVPFFYDWIVKVVRGQKLEDERKLCGDSSESYL